MKYNPLDKLFRSVIPVAYDDSISYYEMVSKVIEVMQQYMETSSITYADPFQWNIKSQYARNTLVIDPETGTAYLSLQSVPSGVQITNTEYWTPVFTLHNFTEALKTAITTVPQQENGQAATQEIPANSVFFVGDVLCTNKEEIPVTSIVVIGSNCRQVSVIELLCNLAALPTAWYRDSDTSINMGFPPAATTNIYEVDGHIYDEEEQTIIITDR